MSLEKKYVRNAVRSACEIVGSQASLARAISVAPAYVHQWIKGIRPVPANRCVAIEKATKGAVSRKDLRSDWKMIWPELDTAQ